MKPLVKKKYIDRLQLLHLRLYWSVNSKIGQNRNMLNQMWKVVTAESSDRTWKLKLWDAIYFQHCCMGWKCGLWRKIWRTDCKHLNSGYLEGFCGLCGFPGGMRRWFNEQGGWLYVSTVLLNVRFVYWVKLKSAVGIQQPLYSLYSEIVKIERLVIL